MFSYLGPRNLSVFCMLQRILPISAWKYRSLWPWHVNWGNWQLYDCYLYTWSICAAYPSTLPLHNPETCTNCNWNNECVACCNVFYEWNWVNKLIQITCNTYRDQYEQYLSFWTKRMLMYIEKNEKLRSFQSMRTRKWCGDNRSWIFISLIFSRFLSREHEKQNNRMFTYRNTAWLTLAPKSILSPITLQHCSIVFTNIFPCFFAYDNRITSPIIMVSIIYD